MDFEKKQKELSEDFDLAMKGYSSDKELVKELFVEVNGKKISLGSVKILGKYRPGISGVITQTESTKIKLQEIKLHFKEGDLIQI